MSGPCPPRYGVVRDISCMYTNPTDALALNAIGTVILPAYTLTGSSPQPSVSLSSCTRAEGIQNPPLISSYSIVRGPAPPDRPPSSLPPPANLSLALSLGKYISHGRAGVVFEASIDVQNSSPAVATYAIPPLVVKVARLGHDIDLRHEAFYYDEMECIQGIVVPRCYGLFEGKIKAGASLIPPTEEYKVWKYLHLRPEELELDVSHGSSSSSDWDAADDTPQRAARPWAPPQTWTAAITDSASSRNLQTGADLDVCFLIMERLGERLPIGQKLPDYVIPEVLDMYNHLAILGIEHVDIRHANLLRVLDSPPGWPNIISTHSGNPYRYRIIDFENSRKTNWSFCSFKAYHVGWVTRLLEALPLGYVLEISDF